MGTQKNRLNETVLLSTQNICFKLWVRKYLQFYAEKFCLSKPVLPVTSEARTLGDRILAKASSPGRLVRNTLVNFLSSASISINKGKML